MKYEKIDGVEEVIMSMAGCKRAKPRENLFEEIYAKYISPTDRIITRIHFRLAITASLLLLCFNSYLIHQTLNNSDVIYSQRIDQGYSQELSFGNYNIYNE